MAEDNNETSQMNEVTETVPEAFMRKISGDPQFIIVKPAGEAFVIGFSGEAGWCYAQPQPACR
jgi:hypothetical protein